VSLLQAGRGAEVVQETRLWDEGRQETTSMRTKEGLADYRWGAGSSACLKGFWIMAITESSSCSIEVVCSHRYFYT
jgi:hypothetical protein